MTCSVSKRRLAANRANARNSTGPKTPAGKARSARNSLKHGLLSCLSSYSSFILHPSSFRSAPPSRDLTAAAAPPTRTRRPPSPRIKKKVAKRTHFSALAPSKTPIRMQKRTQKRTQKHPNEPNPAGETGASWVSTSLTFVPNPLIGWCAVEAMGMGANRIAENDPDYLREHLRRRYWLLSEESGGICWRAPEAMAEIVRHRPVLFADYIPIVVLLILGLSGLVHRILPFSSLTGCVTAGVALVSSLRSRDQDHHGWGLDSRSRPRRSAIWSRVRLARSGSRPCVKTATVTSLSSNRAPKMTWDRSAD